MGGFMYLDRHSQDSLERIVLSRTPPRNSHQKAKEHGLKLEGPQRAHKYCQNLSTVGESKQLSVKNAPQFQTGLGGLHALQEQSQLEMQCISNAVEDQVCAILASNLGVHQQIKTPREADMQADVLSQVNARKEFQTPPTVAPVVGVHHEQHEVQKKRNNRNQSNVCVQRGIERLADKLIDQAVNEVASELAEFCETLADQMYTAEFVT